MIQYIVCENCIHTAGDEKVFIGTSFGTRFFHAKNLIRTIYSKCCSKKIFIRTIYSKRYTIFIRIKKCPTPNLMTKASDPIDARCSTYIHARYVRSRLPVATDDSSPTRARVTRHHSVEIENRFKSLRPRGPHYHTLLPGAVLEMPRLCVRAYHGGNLLIFFV